MYRPVTEEIGPEEPPDFSSDPDMDDDTTNNELSTEDSSSPQRMPYPDVDTIDAAVVDFSSSGARTDAKRAHSQGRVFVQCDATYLFTLPGIFKVFQLMSTVAALLCVITVTYNNGGYLTLPAAWRFRVFVFTSVVSLLVSVLVLVCRATNLARLMPINWILLVTENSDDSEDSNEDNSDDDDATEGSRGPSRKRSRPDEGDNDGDLSIHLQRLRLQDRLIQDLILSVLLALLYLISSSMVANAYIEFQDQFKEWASKDKLLAGVLLSFCCFILYTAHSVLMYWRYHRSGHFRHQLLRGGSTTSDLTEGNEPDVIT